MTEARVTHVVSQMKPLSTGGKAKTWRNMWRHQRAQTAQRVALLRLVGVSLFLLLSIILGYWLHLASWTGNLDLFVIYWIASACTWAASERFDGFARWSAWAIAVFDVPVVFALQYQTLAQSDASGVAGFNVGIYVFFVSLAALAFEPVPVVAVAVSGAVFEVALQRLAHVSVGGQIATVVLLFLASWTCAQASIRLKDLVETVINDNLDLAETKGALVRSEQTFRDLIRLFPDGIAVVSQDRVIYANQALTTMLQIPPPEPLVDQLVVDKLVAAADPLAMLLEEVRRQSNLFSEQETPNQEGTTLYRHDGTSFDAEVTLLSVTFHEAPAILAIARDISERKRLQQRLLITSRLVSLGTLVAGIAHEINNPLSYLTSNVSFVRQALVDIEMNEAANDISEALEECQEGVARIQKVVQGMSTFAHLDQAGKLESVDIKRTLEMAIDLSMTEIRWRATLKSDLLQVPMIQADASRLGQLFLNLLTNAIQAIPEESKGGEIAVGCLLDPYERIVVTFADNGVGMSQELCDRIFDPFFTTKTTGTGLGLPICHSIVDSMGGQISIDSELGQGTTVTVIFPTKTVSPRPKATPTITPLMKRAEKEDV